MDQQTSRAPQPIDLPAPREGAVTLNDFLAAVERRAYRIAVLAVGHDDALDAVQEAMFKLVERYSDRPSEEWAPLFYRILQSKIRDQQRRQTLRRALQWVGWRAGDEEGDAIAQLPDRISTTPEQREQQQRSIAALFEALQELPSRQREAFLLRFWEELDVAQTARAMNCSEGSVKTHYSRAIQRLRQRLGEHWP